MGDLFHDAVGGERHEALVLRVCAKQVVAHELRLGHAFLVVLGDAVEQAQGRVGLSIEQAVRPVEQPLAVAPAAAGRQHEHDQEYV